jgi:hypothetical protein
MHQNQLRNKYNPEYYHNRAISLLDLVDPVEAINWYNHPCTEALRNALEGDLAGVVIMWLGGAYSDEKSTSGTAQRQAKARGMANAIDDMIEHIEGIKNLNLEGSQKNDNRNGSQGSSALS